MRQRRRCLVEQEVVDPHSHHQNQTIQSSPQARRQPGHGCLTKILLAEMVNGEGEEAGLFLLLG